MAGENVISSMIVQISAQNTASAELTKVGKDMNTAAIAGRSMGEKIGDASASFAKMGYTVNSAMMMMDRFEVSQLSLDSANVQVDQSQRRYNEALSKYGENSSQAQTAAASLAVAQNSLNSANIRANSSMVLIGLSALAMVPQFMAAGKALVLFATTGKLAIAGLTLTMSTMAPYLIVIGAALGGLYYWYTKNQEAAYQLRSEQTALSDSTNLVISSYSSMFASLSPIEAATGELAVKQVALKAAFKAWMKAIEEFGPDSPEVKAAEATYKNIGKEADTLEQKLKDLNTEMEKPMPAPSTTKVTDWKDALMGMFGAIVGRLDWVIQKTYEFYLRFWAIWMALWNMVWNYTVDILNQIVSAIMTPLQDLWNWLFGASIIPDIVDGFASAWESIKNFTITAWESIKNAIMSPITNTWNWLVSAWDSITTYLSGKWDGIKSTASTTWDGIKSAILNPINNTWTWLVSAWDSITAALGNAWDDIKTLASDSWTAIAGAIWGALPEWLQDMIHGVFTWTWPALPDWSAAWNSMLNTIYGILPSWFKVLLGLEEPPTPYSDWSNSGWSDSGGGGGGWDNTGWSGDSGTGYSDVGGWSGEWSGDAGYSDWGWTGDGGYNDTGGFAKGGIVTKPTRALIGEAGPEAIIPLPGYLKGGGMGAINVTLNIGNVYGVDDLDAAIKQAFENLQWQIRAAGG